MRTKAKGSMLNSEVREIRLCLCLTLALSLYPLALPALSLINTNTVGGDSLQKGGNIINQNFLSLSNAVRGLTNTTSGKLNTTNGLGYGTSLTNAGSIYLETNNQIRITTLTNGSWGIYPGSNAGESGHPNPVLEIGFNTGRLVTNDISWRWLLEADYKSGGLNYNEAHLQRDDPDGRSYRVQTVVQRRNGASNIIQKFYGDTSFYQSLTQTNLDPFVVNIGDDGKVIVGPGNVTYNVAPLEVYGSNYNAVGLLIGGNATGGVGTDAALGFFAVNGAANRPEYARIGLDAEEATVGAESGHLTFWTRNQGTNFFPRMRLSHEGNLAVGITNDPTAAVDIGGSTVRLRTARTPASASAAGLPGEFCWDANYFYIVVATNTWRRAAHSTW